MNIFANSIPDAMPRDIVAWAEESRLQVDGHVFDSALNPQAIKPMRAMADEETRIGTFIKPVQSGGSTAGEIVLAWWARFAHGLTQFNWQDDLKAAERWKDRILPCLESVPGLQWAGGRDSLICEARFVNSTIRAQGVFNENALNSDTIPNQINEEVHLWKPGHLAMARDRQTRIWNSKAFDISNAGKVGDQLHSAFNDGTMEEWETVCPKCRVIHAMHFRFNPSKPELGGLRWDSSTRLADGKPNYNKLLATIRYQFPCGHEVLDLPHERRTLKGDYSAPKNEGAHISHRSWISEAVSYDQISWLTLIKEWHGAIQALKSGDEEPMFRFVTRRECKFYSPESIPFSGMVIVNNSIVKSRDGLKGRAARFWFADKQKGYAHKGELTHYWLVIRDVMPNCDSQLVFEGLVQTDSDLLARLEEHGCVMQSGAVDCGWDRNNVQQFCYRAGCNAQTTSAQNQYFYHREEKAYRIYSEPEGLHKQMKVPPKHDYVLDKAKMVAGKMEYVPASEEPLHWSIHRVGSIKLLFFLRGHQKLVTQNGGTDFIKWEVPGDVSEEYKKQMESWEFKTRKKPATNAIEEICRQRFQADHMLMAEAGIANLMAMSGILSQRLAQMGITESVIGETANNTKPTEEK